MKYCIGVDLGGTNIKIGIVDIETAQILVSSSVPTKAPRPAEDIAVDIFNLSKKLLCEINLDLSEIMWVGVASPGIVKNGTVITATNLAWRNVPFGMILSRMIGKEVHLANDANAAAYAEALAGVGKGKSTLAILTLGTGVGGGLVINGRIFEGFNGFAAEMGHMVINADGRECGCGKRGCLEAYCSATAIVKESRRVMSLYKDSLMWKLCDFDIDNLNAKIPFDAKEMSDIAATKVVDDFIDNLAVGISNVINVFQPSVLCIGGGVSSQGDALMIPLRDRVERYSFGFAEGRTKLYTAKFKNDAGIIGASLLGLQERDDENMSFAEKLIGNFNIDGDYVSEVPYGNGHINDTYLVTTRVNGGENKYILQRINKNVFKDPAALMDNFAKVTEYLSNKIVENGGDSKRETLNVIKTYDGKNYFLTPEGDYWRLLIYVTDNVCYDKVEKPEQFYESAVAFGNFQRMLKDFPADTLVETIPNFHNTPKRYENFIKEVESDKLGRLASVAEEVAFVKARKEAQYVL